MRPQSHCWLPCGSSSRQSGVQWAAACRLCALTLSLSGVDVSPIVWVALISFLNEVLLGKQGILVLLASKSIAAAAAPLV